jgi:hypothetical protein
MRAEFRLTAVSGAAALGVRRFSAALARRGATLPSIPKHIIVARPAAAATNLSRLPVADHRSPIT